MHSSCVRSIFALIILTIGELLKNQSATKSHSRCVRCGSDLTLPRIPGCVLYRGITVALPEAFGHEHSCHGCGKVTLTPALLEELDELIDRNEIGVGRRGEPVMRGT